MGLDVELNVLEGKLLESYRKHFFKAPSWAYPVAPPIPFVGKDYPENGGGSTCLCERGEPWVYMGCCGTDDRRLGTLIEGKGQ